MLKEGKSLLEKYDLQLEQLDYNFIESCKNVRTLERILIVLRSGEEGIYPDLVKFCENRLRTIAPKSKLVHCPQKILQYCELSEEERKEIINDMENWLSDRNSEEVKEGLSKKVKNLPPVRGKSVKIATKMKSDDESCEKNKKAQRTPRSYSEWNKFDVEEELKKLEDGETCYVSNENKKQMEKDTGLQKLMSLSDLSERERQYIADLEKNKGNEAFKAHDYEEAALYYTRSISAFKSTAALNNRAQAYIRLKNYLSAIQDCTEVIGMEPNNLKALYRRGLAYKETGFYDLAKLDFQILLELEPENKRAKDQLKELKQMKLTKPEKKRVVIEEIESEEMKITENGKDDGGSSGICTRMKIEEVTTTENTEKLTNIKYDSSDEDDDVSPSQLPTKVKQMLQISKPKMHKDSQKTVKIDEYEKISLRETKIKGAKKVVDCDDISPHTDNLDKPSKLNADSNFVKVEIEDCNPVTDKFLKLKEFKTEYANIQIADSGNKVLDKDKSERNQEIKSELDLDKINQKSKECTMVDSNNRSNICRNNGNIKNVTQKVSVHDSISIENKLENLNTEIKESNINSAEIKILSYDKSEKAKSRKITETSSRETNLEKCRLVNEKSTTSTLDHEIQVDNQPLYVESSKIKELEDCKTSSQINSRQSVEKSVVNMHNEENLIDSSDVNIHNKSADDFRSTDENESQKSISFRNLGKDNTEIFIDKILLNDKTVKTLNENVISQYDKASMKSLTPEMKLCPSNEDLMENINYETQNNTLKDIKPEPQYKQHSRDIPQDLTDKKLIENITEKIDEAKVSKEKAISMFTDDKSHHNHKEQISEEFQKSLLEDEENEKNTKSDIKSMNSVQEKLTPHEFHYTWSANDASKDSEVAAACLLRINPQDLPCVISNKIDASMLYGLLVAVHKVHRMGRTELTESYLYYLTKVLRIKIAAMLLSQEEIQSIQSLFSTLDDEKSEHMKYINKILQT